jgi:hypothetical protein
MLKMTFDSISSVYNQATLCSKPKPETTRHSSVAPKSTIIPETLQPLVDKDRLNKSRIKGKVTTRDVFI